MSNKAAWLPETDILTGRLAGLLGVGVLISDRQPNRYASIFVSEIVTCRLSDGRELRLLCKSSIAESGDPAGHRGKIAYEAGVYRDVLQPCGMSVPAYYGTFQDCKGEMWLVLEYLEESVPIEKAPNQTQAIATAAQWIGRFHANQQHLLETRVPPWLDRLDADHYRNCARRTAEFAADLRAELPWMRIACQRFERQIIDLLVAQPITVIHGDYFTDNILSCRGTVWPIDWEWAALGPGEADIACLTEQWPEDTVSRWVNEYTRARWPEGLPPDFNLVLKAVRIYLSFRYLAIAPDRISDPQRRWRLEIIRSIADAAQLT